MLQCTKILVPKDDQNDFRLTDAQVPAVEGRRLDKLIPEFFSCGKYGIRIAVACGSDLVWSAEEFAQSLKRCAVSIRKDSVYSWKIEKPDTVYVANIYATTDDKSGTNLDSVMGAFHGSIRNICHGIMEKTTEKTSELKDKIQTACTQLENLEKNPCLRSITDMFAKSISESLFSDDVVCGFPTVMILVFLPEFAFEAFLDQNSYFFKQIEYVLFFESEDRRKREEAESRASRLSQELEAAKSELEETKRQLQAETSESKRKKLEALLDDKERTIAELQESLTSAKQEIDRLESNLVAEKSKNAELEGLLASEVTRNKALETALNKQKDGGIRTLIIPSRFTSYFSYNLDLLTLAQNNNWYSNETEMKETAMMNPGYSKYVGPLASKEGRGSIVTAEMETNPSIQDSDLTEQTAVADPEKSVQIANSPDGTRNMVGFIEKDDRQSRKEEGHER